MERKCDNCGRPYTADMRNVKRGWGLCCSKSCAASKREKSKPNYSPIRVAKNNIRRATWNAGGIGIDENYYGVYRGRRTSEGYKVYSDGDTHTAVDKFGDAVYTFDGCDDIHPFDFDN